MRPAHAAIFSVIQSSPGSVHIWEEGSQEFLTFLHTSAASSGGHRSPHFKPRTTTILKPFCVGEKLLRVIHLGLELFTLQELTNSASGWS